MRRRSRSQFILALAVALAALYLTPATAIRAEPQQATAPARTVDDVSLLGVEVFETGFTFAGTEVGGLSGITYNPRRNVYYVLSDDRSELDPARFYTVTIDIADGVLDDGDVTFQDVTTLRTRTGEPYPPGGVDPEDIAFAGPRRLFISSEGDASLTPPLDPFVNRYNLRGYLTGTLPIPAKFLPDGSGERGVRANLGFEGLTVTPDRRTLYTGTENALAQDGPISGIDQRSLSRIIEYDLRRGRPAHEYVYVVEPIPEPPVPPDEFADNGLVALLALDNSGTMLALERSFAVGVGNTIKLFEISTYSATDVSRIADLYDEDTGRRADFEPVEKRLIIDFADLGLTPDNVEGMSFGPPLPDGRVPLIAVSDNNFNPAQETQFIALALSFRDSRGR